MRKEQPSHSLNDREAAERHNRVLLHALQTGHPVQRDGRNAYLRALYFQDHGGTIDVRVYVVGEPEPYAPEAISLATNYRKEFPGTVQGEESTCTS